MWVIQWLRSRSERNAFDIPIRNFGKINETMYRGALPDTEGYKALKERLGVTRVCSLIEHERTEDRRRALDAGIVEWRHMPFSDRDRPAPSRVREWLDYIRTSVDGPIFTHCRGGRHRTGFLTAVYRMTDCGWTWEQALEEMDRYGWYGALGHKPILDWLSEEFDASEYRRKPAD